MAYRHHQNDSTLTQWCWGIQWGRQSYFRVSLPLLITTLLKCSAVRALIGAPPAGGALGDRLACLCLETVLHAKTCRMESRSCSCYSGIRDAICWTLGIHELTGTHVCNASVLKKHVSNSVKIVCKMQYAMIICHIVTCMVNLMCCV